jgi:hypothetical protein
VSLGLVAVVVVRRVELLALVALVAAVMEQTTTRQPRQAPRTQAAAVVVAVRLEVRALLVARAVQVLSSSVLHARTHLLMVRLRSVAHQPARTRPVARISLSTRSIRRAP